LTIFIAIIHLVMRKLFKQKLSDGFVIANLYFIVPISLLLTLGAFYIEEYGLLFPNYFFINFHFYYQSLAFLAVPAIVLASVQASKSFWLKHWKNLFFMLMAILIVGGGVLFYVEEELYKKLIIEDSLVEWLTALAFMISGFIALFFIKKKDFFKNKIVRKIFVAGCLFVGMCLLFVAGEEASWGQRIINFETPGIIAEQNRQGEINLHNSELIWPYVYSAYLTLGLYGMLFWILEWLTRDLIKFKKSHEVWKLLLIPGGYLFLNFAFISLYVWLRLNHGPWKYQNWEEFAELILVIGIMVHLAQSYLNFPKLKTQK
jgi:hypothetical protein